jgi:branched-chain amino acid aminotransferase
VANAVIASVDGRISPAGDAKISILDEGLIRGDGAFEVMKLYGGRPFRLRAHLDRLGRSAAAIELEFDLEVLEAEISALLGAGCPPDGCFRIVITRGGRRLLTAEDLSPFAPSIAVATVELTPSEILAGVKSISYAANMQATRIAASRGADEAVYVRPDGIVLEAPTSSVFWVDSGTLKTPALSVGILDSITRDVVVEALEVEAGDFTLDSLTGAEEAFLASTNREIQPISSVNGEAIATVGGPACGEARQRLSEAVEAERAATTASN